MQWIPAYLEDFTNAALCKDDELIGWFEFPARMSISSDRILITVNSKTRHFERLSYLSQ